MKTELEKALMALRLEVAPEIVDSLTVIIENSHTEYASTKAEEGMRDAFQAGEVAGYFDEHKELLKETHGYLDFDEWYTQYKEKNIMTPEEQLIHDILVLEERKQFANNEELCKLSARQLKAVREYASTKAEEVAKKFACYVFQPYTTDELKPEDFNDRFTEYKHQ